MLRANRPRCPTPCRSASSSCPGSGFGRDRNLRASSATSLKSTRPSASRMTSRRSPYSAVAASVQCPAAPGTGFRSAEPDEHRPAGRIANVAHRPVAALAPTVRQIMAADRLGLSAETDRQVGGVVTGHQAASRSPMRSTGKRSRSLPMISGPGAPTGTKKRSFQEMISLKRP